MKSCRSCWSILLFLGSSHPLLIDIPQESVNGTVGHSVLLPVSYKFQEPFSFPLTIRWYFSETPNPLATYTMTNCSVSAEGIPTSCSGSLFIHRTYHDRVLFFPENASLLLQNLKLSDSGIYSITLGTSQQSSKITLTVSEPQSDSRTPAVDPLSDTLILGLSITGSFSFLLFLLVLLQFFGCRWRKGAVQRKQTRIIKQQEVPIHEESPTESSLPKTVSTIYSRIGENVGQKHTRSESPVEYATINFSWHQL